MSDAPVAPPADSGRAAPGRYPDELERRWQPAGGPVVTLRALRPDDLAREWHFVTHLSAHTLYLRVQYSASSPTREELERLLAMDYVDRLALGALVEQDGEETLVGVSRYARIEGTDDAECAIVVADAWQGRGLGTELMRSLVSAARERGIRRLVGETLAENSSIAGWARRFGFVARTEPHSGGQITLTLDLASLPPDAG